MIMEKARISNGIHTLSGINDLIIKGNYEDPYYLSEDANGYVFILDGKTYVVFEDPEDGYRSCGKICEAKNGEICTNIFPEQKVLVKYINGIKEDDWCNYKIWYYEFRNPKTKKLILKIGTDNYDDYYPMSIFEYHPENLPINLNR